MRYHLTPVRMVIIKNSINTAEVMEKRAPSCITGGNVNWCGQNGEHGVLHGEQWSFLKNKTNKQKKTDI